MNHGLKTVPYICTSKQELKRDVNADFYRQEDIWFIKKDDTHETQVQLDFINKRLGHDVPLKLPLMTVLIKNLVMFSVLALVITVLVKARNQLVDPILWWVISLFGYILCTSGFIYSELHGMPMFRFDKDQYGNMFISEYFMKQQRSQYAGEGYIVAFIATAASMFFLLLVRSEALIGEMSKDTRRIVLVLMCVLAYAGVELFLTCYRIKTPWYSSNFMPPKDYIRGPLMRD